MLPPLKGHLAEGEVPGLRRVLPGLSHVLGRGHGSRKQGPWNSGGGVTLGPRDLPFCRVAPTELAPDDESHPFLRGAQLHQLAPLDCRQGHPASHRQGRRLMPAKPGFCQLRCRPGRAPTCRRCSIFQWSRPIGSWAGAQRFSGSPQKPTAVLLPFLGPRTLEGGPEGLPQDQAASLLLL